MLKNESTLVNAADIVARATGGKKLPKPLFKLAKKILHEDDFNEYFVTDKLGYEFAEGFMEHIGATCEVIGAENIPAEGRFTFAFNHPYGMLDAIQSLAYLGRKYDGNIVLPANDLTTIFKQVQEYFVPVNRIGAQARDLSRLMEEAFEGPRQMLIFPAATCSRRINGVIQDYPWTKTFITKSRSSQRDIIPVWFSGRNSRRFYRIDWWCTKLHIKFNVAMFTLASELFKQRGNHFKMVFGKPIPWQTFTKDRKDAEWAAWVRDKVYELKQED
jgi:Putative hemolysin